MKEKKYFSKEQIELLKPAEIHFFSCVYEKWKRGTMMSLNDLVADTYEQTTGEKLPRNWNCASCSFNNYLTIGKLYYESIERLKDQEQNTQETTTPDSTQKVDEVVEADGTLTKALWKEMDEKNGKQLEFDFKDDEPEKPEPEPEKVERTIDQVQDTSETTVPDSTHQVDEVVEVNDSDKVGNETEPALNINELQDKVAETETITPKKKPGRPKKNK